MLEFWLNIKSSTQVGVENLNSSIFGVAIVGKSCLDKVTFKIWE